jgi:hypothetical protein
MFDVKLERDDQRAITERILRYPLAEDIDDYNEYKLAVREQKEKKGVVANVVALPVSYGERVHVVRSTLDGSTDIFFGSIDWNPCDVVSSGV